MKDRIIVGISGASGAIIGIRLLQFFANQSDCEVHLVVSEPAERTISHETDYTMEEVYALAKYVHKNTNIGAPIASGSFKTRGMIIAPCSMKTLSAVANSNSDTLISRSADVTLKEGRLLIVLPRETPLHVGHLKLMVQLAENGAVILPPIPAFYHRPKTVEDIIDHLIARVLDRLGITHDLAQEWVGS